MTPVERFNVLAETPKGATFLLNTILDEYGVIDLLNGFFPNLNDKDQQRILDIVQRRMFAETANKPKIYDEYSFNGKRKTLREWCVDYRIPESVVVKRLCRGWSFERAIETPLKHATIQPGTCGL